MCGRYSLTTTRYDLARELGLPLDAVPEELVPRWNVAPSQGVPVLRQDAALRLDMMQWGLVPHWAKDPAIGNRMINARAETLDEKPAYRDAFRSRRCLLPADGFYEWAPAPGRGPKTPHYIRLKGGGVFTFAGLWSRWRAPDGTPLLSCTIVTSEPNELVANVHDRMPAILPADRRAAWLAPDHDDPESLRPLLATLPADLLEMIPVSRHVNSTDHDDPACIEPATGTDDEVPPGGNLSLF